MELVFWGLTKELHSVSSEMESSSLCYVPKHVCVPPPFFFFFRVCPGSQAACRSRSKSNAFFNVRRQRGCDAKMEEEAVQGIHLGGAQKTKRDPVWHILIDCIRSFCSQHHLQNDPSSRSPRDPRPSRFIPSPEISAQMHSGVLLLAPGVPSPSLDHF